MSQARDFPTMPYRVLFAPQTLETVTRTSVSVWRFYLVPHHLCLFSQAFLSHHPLPKSCSLSSWTECNSYSVILLSFRATDERKQKLAWLGSPDADSQWLCSFFLCLKFLIWLCKQVSRPTGQQGLISRAGTSKRNAHHCPGQMYCVSETGVIRESVNLTHVTQSSTMFFK
jgi:hypothetical protein